MAWLDRAVGAQKQSAAVPNLIAVAPGLRVGLSSQAAGVPIRIAVEALDVVAAWVVPAPTIGVFQSVYRVSRTSQLGEACKVFAALATLSPPAKVTQILVFTKGST